MNNWKKELGNICFDIDCSEGETNRVYKNLESFIEKEIELAKKDMLKKATDYLWGLPWDDEDIKDFKEQMEL